MRVLLFGDPHARPNNIKESEALVQFALDKCLELKVDRLKILGDLLDTHSIVRLEVLEFWGKWIRTLEKSKINTVILTGNHDMCGDYSNTYSALHVFAANKEYVRIIGMSENNGIFGYMPYIHDNEEFVKQANDLAEHGAKVLVSHTTYDGGKFDNGMFAPGGVSPDLLDPRLIHLISGHVHSEQEFGRVWYPGTARWLSKSCANKKKGLWLVDHDDNTGAILSKEFISTESVCLPIISLVWKEGDNCPEIPDSSKVDIELIGSSDWVTKQKLELKGKVSISSKITDTKKSRERKSGSSLFEFLSNFYPTEPEKRHHLIEYMKGLNLV